MTPHKEDYLKVIMELGGDKQLVNNKQIGQALSVSAASVTEMSVKLLKGWLDQPHTVPRGADHRQRPIDRK